MASAIVIGGSIAGLLAARVLRDHYDEVTIIERDDLPDAPEHRNGTPQARHLHALLAQGEQILQTLFPDIEDAFDQQGAVKIRWGLDTITCVSSGWIQRYDAGIGSHVMTRVTLEWIIRQRVQALPNVTFMTQQQVDHLLTNEDKSSVVGVHITSRTTQEKQDLYSNLVVDASGRGSHAMQWLEELGYQAPEETVINSYLGYATRWYHIDNPDIYDWKTVMIAARPKQGLKRSGMIFLVEGNQMIVTLSGANKDYPPTDEEEFLAFAKTLASPAIYNVIKDLKSTIPIYGYRRTENRFRHYEKLSRMPVGFVVMGDAACGFNPLYGQGMTTAAIQALELGKLLKTVDLHHLDGFSLQFQKQLAKAIDGAWLMATGEDMRYEETEGADITPLDRITQRYLDMMLEVMPHDQTICTAFVNAMNLTTHPIALLHPKLMIRVLYRKLFKRGDQPISEPPIKQPITQVN